MHNSWDCSWKFLYLILSFFVSDLFGTYSLFEPGIYFYAIFKMYAISIQSKKYIFSRPHAHHFNDYQIGSRPRV